MHFSHLPVLLSALAPASVLVAAGRAKSYCGGQGALPSKDDCQAAVEKIDTWQTYSGEMEIMAGNCQIQYRPLTIATTETSHSIKGSDLKAQALDIMNDGCRASGWSEDSGWNVSVSICQICRYGVCTVCDAPRRRDEDHSLALLPVALDVTAPSAPPPSHDRVEKPRSERLPRNTYYTGSLAARSAHEARQNQNPEPGVTCRSAFGLFADDCLGLADSLRGKTLPLPYISSAEDCDLAIFAGFYDLAVNGDTVADRITHVTNLCKSSGTSKPLVGTMMDTTQEIPWFGYTMWFGNLCGSFSFGTANCQI